MLLLKLQSGFRVLACAETQLKLKAQFPTTTTENRQINGNQYSRAQWREHAQQLQFTGNASSN